jgi:hypothetical protein
MPRLRYIATCLLCLVFGVSSSYAQNDTFRDPIALIGHGKIYDSQGNEIEATPDFLAETQALYLETLLA